MGRKSKRLHLVEAEVTPMECAAGYAVTRKKKPVQSVKDDTQLNLWKPAYKFRHKER